MRKALLIITLALVSVISANAQFVGGAKYKTLKSDYNYKDYVPSQMDPYSPGWNGVLSFFVPGAGQIVTGEVWRGVLMLVGDAILNNEFQSAANEVGKALLIDQTNNTISWADKENGQKNVWIALGCATASLGLSIWSCIDASRIAKVKDMYFQDKYGHRSMMGIDFAPSLALSPTTSGVKPAAGMALTLSF